MMDIGAGNGKVFKVFSDISSKIEDESKRVTIDKAYAIEKSMTPINAMDENVFIVGTDFWHQTLIDKKVDVIYSNPPYSEYSLWVEKIIKEANSEYVYLLIPDRWKNEPKITHAAQMREAKIEVIGEFSFLDAEDRKARANVHLVKINLKAQAGRYSRHTGLKVEPFELWFKEMYAFDESVQKE
jgi:hypothetical protein